MPGRACFRTGSIRLHRGTAVWPDHRGAWVPKGKKRVIRLSLATFNKRLFTYGDLEGAGISDATVGLYCSNNGGTAGGALLYSVAIFSGRDGKAHLLGLLTPQVQRLRWAATLIDRPKISVGKITWTEAFYGRNDGTCCPSGRASTVWTYTNGKFTPNTTVTRRTR